MAETPMQHAVMMMSRIRHQIFRPDVTTMGACPRCSKMSRGAGVCADCIGKDLDTLLGTDGGTTYVEICRAQRREENKVLAMTASAGSERGESA